MNKLVNIEGNDLQVVAYKGVRVLSSYDIARLHKKEVAKLENGKSIYGASIRQVSLKTGHHYSAKKLTRWCKANCRPSLVVRQDNPNGYSSAKVSVYHAEAWRLYFEEDELFYEETPR